ncbi:SRPBCC family protein [Streptomyces sp. BHT-5-2]|uniref:SRPBCC family protein n=1 Tax=Streptomyces sp. BHT-5-2 TaxID=2866715 RepID=UPI001C8E5781|nr:SRPBCC family protein [Streptomyces sp. BHT-5-2]QZL06394.1 SRPBCC family protein [Streptomyces sp. BHT-5-2]
MAAHTDNEIVIDAPFTTVWSIANDVTNWPDLFDGAYASAEILQGDERRLTFRLTTEPEDDGKQYSWVSERVMDRDEGTVSARRIENGPFLYMHIFQSFETLPGGSTKVRWVQDFEVLPEVPYDDAWFANRINKNCQRELVRHKEYIEARAGGRQ